MRLVACMICLNEEEFIESSLKSIEPVVDKIIVVDGGSTDRTLEILRDYPSTKIEIHVRNWDGSFGRQRQYCLEMARAHKPDWILQVDPDEVMGANFVGVKLAISVLEENKFVAANLRMVHFMRDFGHVDATRDVHWAERRLVKFSDALHYERDIHELLTGFDISKVGEVDITMFHLGYLRNVMISIPKKYEQNVGRSMLHTPEFLKAWLKDHLLGTYAVKLYEGDYPPVLNKMLGLGDLRKWKRV